MASDLLGDNVFKSSRSSSATGFGGMQVSSLSLTINTIIITITIISYKIKKIIKILQYYVLKN